MGEMAWDIYYVGSDGYAMRKMVCQLAWDNMASHI
jgi:hypothetical protein